MISRSRASALPSPPSRRKMIVNTRLDEGKGVLLYFRVPLRSARSPVRFLTTLVSTRLTNKQNRTIVTFFHGKNRGPPLRPFSPADPADGDPRGIFIFRVPLDSFQQRRARYLKARLGPGTPGLIKTNPDIRSFSRVITAQWMIRGRRETGRDRPINPMSPSPENPQILISVVEMQREVRKTKKQKKNHSSIHEFPRGKGTASRRLMKNREASRFSLPVQRKNQSYWGTRSSHSL